MTYSPDYTVIAMFLAGLIVGFIILSAVVAIRGLAQLLVVGLAFGLVGAVILDGEAMMRWLLLSLERMSGAGPLLSGVAAGKLLAGAFLSILRQPHARQGRQR